MSRIESILTVISIVIYSGGRVMRMEGTKSVVHEAQQHNGVIKTVTRS